MSYQNDTLETVYNELEDIESEIYAAAKEAPEYGRKEAEAIAEYENKKGKFLLELAAEEAKDGIKRTEAIRTAMYRQKFADERFERDKAIRLKQAHDTYIKGLMTVINSRQSRLRVLEGERRVSDMSKAA